MRDERVWGAGREVRACLTKFHELSEVNEGRLSDEVSHRLSMSECEASR